MLTRLLSLALGRIAAGIRRVLKLAGDRAYGYLLVPRITRLPAPVVTSNVQVIYEPTDRLHGGALLLLRGES